MYGTSTTDTVNIRNLLPKSIEISKQTIWISAEIHHAAESWVSQGGFKIVKNKRQMLQKVVVTKKCQTSYINIMIILLMML